ncbi:MAG: diguanylate cyclase [Lachnospiraceae bacterium]|nr:diguanylate cyclase [Lachnospiraceae bacterium]
MAEAEAQSMTNDIEGLRQELEDTREQLDILLASMPGGVMTYDADTGKIIYINEGMLSIFGCGEEEFRKHFMDSFSLFVMKEDRHRVKDLIDTQIQFFDHVELTYRAVGLMGDIVWFVHKATLRRLADGRKVFFCILSDVTEQRAIQEQLQATNDQLYMETERFKLIEEAIDNVEYDYDVDSDNLSVSRKDSEGVRHWKNVDDAFKGGQVFSAIHPEDRDVVKSVYESALKNEGKGVVEYRMAAEGEAYMWYRLNYASFEGKNERIIRMVGSAKDITEEKLEQERLRTEAERDGMTGLLNKTAMQLYCAALLAKSEFNDCHALFMIDTDNFKSVNDTLGHGIGDDTIKFVARGIKNVFRDTDLVGRMGGDEFMVLMSHTTLEIAEERARRLNDKIRSEVKGLDESVHISCSIGIAFYAKNGEDYDSLFKAADSALYEAKESGKDCYRVYGESSE